MTDQMIRVEWREDRLHDGFFLIIAEWDAGEWEFWERESWEASWFRIPTSPERIALAEKRTERLHPHGPSCSEPNAMSHKSGA